MTAAKQTHDVDWQLASFAAGAKLSDLGNAEREHAAASFANIVGVSLGGTIEQAALRAQTVLSSLGTGGPARVVGLGTALPLDRVAVLDGVLAHVLDFDDTHLETIMHASAPVMAGLLPLAEARHASGAEFLVAWSVGLEAGIRLAQALGHAHYDRGWHVTGTAGGVAAAAACARLLELDDRQTLHAVGIAATQASGQREQFGYMTKSLHVGISGQAGLVAALLAAQGFDAAPGSIGGRRGLLTTAAPEPSPRALVDGLGERWVLTENCLKPYASGVVTHPVIDAARALRAERGNEDVESVEISVHPLVIELTGKMEPQTGLEGKFSARHCATMGLLDDKAGPAQFTDERVTDPRVIALRDRITVHATDDVAHMTARLTARLTDGSSVELVIDRARGSMERPLTADEVRAKFLDVSAVVLASSEAGRLFERLLAIEHEPDVAEVVSATIAKADSC